LRILIDARHIRDFGIGTYIRNLIRALASIESRHEFVLAIHPRDRAELEGLPPRFRPVPYQRPDTSRADNLTFPLFVRGHKPDLAHIPGGSTALLMPKPYVVTVHDLASLTFDTRTGWRHDMRLYRIRRGLHRAERVIAVSMATKRDVVDLLNVPPERVTYIPGAPDPRYLTHRPAADARATGPDAAARERTRILERYQINYPFLLYAGTIRPQKNIPRMVEAFALLRGELEQHPVYANLRLIIIGDELSRYPTVRQAVIQSRVENQVRFLGFVPLDTLRVFYESAAAFVFPSLYEGFGLPPLEAMASGTPVVTSNVSSLPEVVGNAALIVSPDNVFDIARGMREVLLDDALRDALIERGYEQVKRFSWERTAREVLALYNEVGSTRKRPS